MGRVFLVRGCDLHRVFSFRRSLPRLKTVVIMVVTVAIAIEAVVVMVAIWTMTVLLVL